MTFFMVFCMTNAVKVFETKRKAAKCSNLNKYFLKEIKIFFSV